jgi:hypothetical protein
MCAVPPRPARNKSGGPLPPQSKYSKRASFTFANLLAGSSADAGKNARISVKRARARENFTPHSCIASSDGRPETYSLRESVNGGEVKVVLLQSGQH